MIQVPPLLPEFENRTLLVSIIALTLSFVLVYLIHNIWFHPLSKFPGPTWAAATPLWSVKHWLGGDYPHAIKSLHDRYGPVVRPSPNELSFCSSKSWKDIYGHIPGRQPFVKSGFYDPLPGEAHNIVFVSDLAAHASMRKSLAHGFSSKALSSQEDLIQHYVDQLVLQLKENCTEEAGDVVKWYNYTTFDTIGELAFGESFQCLETGKSHFWIDILFDGLKVANFANIFEHFPTLKHLFRKLWVWGLLPQIITEPRDKQMEYAREKITKRVENPPTRVDLLTKMIADREKDQTSLADLQSQASLLVVAGSETTATALAGITYYLCRNPEIYHRLAQEIRSSFSRYEEIDSRSAETLVYLKAVIDEGLRLYPPIPGGPPRVSPGETIDGDFVPRGTVVSVNIWAAGHYEPNFRDALTFSPERWLDPNTTDVKTASQPFMIGSRGCLGRNLAYVEMRLILAKILWTFDMELMASGRNWIQDNKNYTFWEKPELPVKFTLRNQS